MNLNKNIKFIIYTYLTYSESQIKEFKKDWQKNINKVNKLFNITIADYLKECYVCQESLHRNSECLEFYYCQHTINTLKLE